jgi:hypothetical protein
MPRRVDELRERSLYFQTKYRELHEHFATLRQGYLLVECAWCKRRIGWKRKDPSVPGDTSHGICPPCAAELCKEMQALNQTSDSAVA